MADDTAEGRVVRLKARKKAKVKPKKKARSFQELMEDVQRTNAEKVGEGLTESEIETIIDEAAALDVQQKLMAKQVNAAKGMLKANAEVVDWRTKAGAKAVATIAPGMSTTIGFKAMARELRRLGKLEDLGETILSVKIGEAKKYLGKDVVEEIAVVETTEIGSVSLKLIK